MEMASRARDTLRPGMYNCVTRACEPELIPALRKLDMRFLVYNPLAGGLLTGKHAMETRGEPGEGRGRFKENAMYQDRFWKAEYFEAVDKIRAACEAGFGRCTFSVYFFYPRHQPLVNAATALLHTHTMTITTSLTWFLQASTTTPIVVCRFNSSPFAG